jgi:tetratricopeptide (TPR) repeat protein
LFLPVKLVPDYGRSPRWLLAQQIFWFTWIIPAALFALASLVRRRAPWLWASLLLFLFGLAPMLGLKEMSMQFYSSVADRYVYLAMVGPCLLVAWLLLKIPPARLPVALLAVVLPVAATLAVLSHAQCRRWYDTDTLFTYTLSVNPTSLAGLRITGYRLVETGDLDGAERRYRAALETQPNDASTLYNLGNLLLQQNQFTDAAELYGRIPLRGTHGALAQNNLGIALIQLGKFEDATAAFRTASRLDPTYRDPADNLARLARRRAAAPPVSAPAP